MDSRKDAAAGARFEWRIVALLCACSLISACVPSRFIMTQAERHNDVVADVQNGMLMLNILRAAKQQPTYITSLTILRGDATLVAGTGNITTPFGGGGDEKYSAAPNASLTVKPSFDMSVLDTQDFYRGNLQAVPIETLGYFLDQGWPRQLVLHMFIREIRLKSGRRIVNTPSIDGLGYFTGFQSQMNRWTQQRIEVVKVNQPKCLGPAFDAKAIPNPEVLMKLDAAGFKLLEGLCPEQRIEAQPSERQEAGLLHFERMESSYELKVHGLDVCAGEFGIETEAASARSSCSVLLRSPEAMMYYLGEIVRRQQLEPTWNPMIHVGRAFACDSNTRDRERTGGWDRASILFRIDKVTEARDSYAVVTEFDQDLFGIRTANFDCPRPEAPEDRSMHALRLLSQVIALQKSSQSFPVPQTLRVTN